MPSSPTVLRVRSSSEPTVDLEVRVRPRPGAPIVVLVHGYPDTQAVWTPVADLLAEEFEVVTFDCRGAGASTVPLGVRQYRLDRLQTDLLAVLDAVAGGRPVHLVGHDWGSIHSWETVTDPACRDRIASFTSLSGPCLDHAGAWLRRFLTGRAAARPALRQLAMSWYIYLFQLPLVPTLLWLFGRRAFLRRAPVAPGHPASTLTSDGRHGAALYRANMLPRLLRPRKRYTDIPVLLLVATEDFAVSPAAAEAAQPWVSDLRRVEIPADHWAQVTHPVEVAEAVSRFVGEVERGL